MLRHRNALTTGLLLCALALTACNPRTAAPDGATPTPPSATQLGNPSSPPSSDPSPAAGPTEADPAAEVLPCPEKPEAGMLPFGRVDSVGNGRAVTEGLCETIAPAESTYISFEFPVGITEEVIRTALQVTGAEVTQFDLFNPESGARLILNIGPADPGAVTTVRIQGPVGFNGAPAVLGFRLRREVSPTLTTDVSVNGGPWRRLEPGEYLPQAPLRLRLTFTQPLPHEQVENQFTWVLSARKDAEGIPHQLTWSDDRTLLVDLPEPPPALFVDLGYIEDNRGLRTRGESVYLHTGEAPRLVALDPSTGRETALEPAPVDIEQAVPSPDGRWVVLQALRPDSTYESDVWLLETATGQLTKTGLVGPVNWNGYHWLPDRLVVPGGGAIQEWDLINQQSTTTPVSGFYSSPLSPDGRYLAGFELHYDKEDPETWLAPLTLMIFDLTTRTEKLFPEIGIGRVSHSDSLPRLPMAWSADGRQVIVRQSGGPMTLPQDYWAALDLATGVLSPTDTKPEEPVYDGAGRRITSETGWVYHTSGWGAISLRSPEGAEAAYGGGLPLTWRSDGQLLLVRWPDYQHRRFPGI